MFGAADSNPWHVFAALFSHYTNKTKTFFHTIGIRQLCYFRVRLAFRGTQTSNDASFRANTIFCAFCVHVCVCVYSDVPGNVSFLVCVVFIIKTRSSPKRAAAPSSWSKVHHTHARRCFFLLRFRWQCIFFSSTSLCRRPTNRYTTNAAISCRARPLCSCHMKGIRWCTIVYWHLLVNATKCALHAHFITHWSDVGEAGEGPTIELILTCARGEGGRGRIRLRLYEYPANSLRLPSFGHITSRASVTC